MTSSRCSRGRCARGMCMEAIRVSAWRRRCRYEVRAFARAVPERCGDTGRGARPGRRAPSASRRHSVAQRAVESVRSQRWACSLAAMMGGWCTWRAGSGRMTSSACNRSRRCSPGVWKRSSTLRRVSYFGRESLTWASNSAAELSAGPGGAVRAGRRRASRLLAGPEAGVTLGEYTDASEETAGVDAYAHGVRASRAARWPSQSPARQRPQETVGATATGHPRRWRSPPGWCDGPSSRRWSRWRGDSRARCRKHRRNRRPRG